MKAMQRLLRAGLFAVLALALGAAATFARQTQNGTLRGQVTDEFGGTIVGATVTASNAGGVEKTATTNGDGVYAISGLAPGTYTVRATAGGFAMFEDAGFEVSAGARNTLDIKLSVALQKEEVTVAVDSGISTAPESNADALVLRGKDLEALPDDPEDLSSALTALAGPSAGPNGGQIYIDGFTGGRLPPKESIREVRINQNPYNAENDRPGFGRVDILTRPGMDKFRGGINTSFGDEALNSRNPFAPARTDYQSRSIGFNLSGPIISKKSSFFVDFQTRAEDDNDVITATVLDPLTLAPTAFDLAVLTPRRFTTFSPRFDYAFNQNHTLVARYSYTQSSNLAGIGGFSLQSRAFDTSSKEHNVQLTMTDVLNATTINETRFQFNHARRGQEGDNSTPAIQVLDAFTGGGAFVGLSFNQENRWELQNYTTHTHRAHTMRFGVRLRGVRLTDVSDSNFNGTFTFTSLDQYRSAVTGGVALPSQFTVSGGDPEARVSQYDLGAFFQDEWRIRPNFSMTMGLRYETQSNISSHLNLAPRIFFAWAPGGTSTGTINPFGGGAGQPKFVIRGGFGIFYDRFGEGGTLQANRFSGLGQQRFVVSDPTRLSGVVFTPTGVVASTIPTVEELSGFLVPQTVTRVSDELQAPRTVMTAVQAERQLPGNWTIFGVFFNYRQQRVFRQRNVNAFLPGTFAFGDPSRPGVRPNPAEGDVYQYESTGKFNDYRLQVGVRNQIRPGFSVFANYNTGKATSDTDCIFGGIGGCFPADSYDLSNENGRVAFFARHQFHFGGNLAIPKLKLSLNPFIIARTGQFFNIISGVDRNGDGIFNDRPAFADAQTTTADLVHTQWGDFDRNPKPGQTIIPRNLGEGPAFLSINLGVSRTFSFGNKPGAAGVASAAAPQGGGARPGGPGGPGGGGGAVRVGGPGGPGGGPGGAG
ncbi:MAG: carboxypeptidase regulatory-like domain-containing protein, partial [Acidobacteria bacterium]|nr:carboxypeptidase regulatory-like domain-containing protein [Acidobacteriota bacterium]